MIYNVKGLRVAVIGMGNVSTITSIYEGGNSLGFRPIADEDALERWVRILRPVVDVVVVVSHLGLDEDEDLTASQVNDPNQEFKRETLSGVDLILGGHLHIVTDPPKLIPNDDEGHNTILVHSGAFAKFVGRLDVVVHVGDNNAIPGQRSRITSFTYDNIPVDSKTCTDPDTNVIGPCIPEDAEVANLMWPYSVKINQEIDLGGVFAYINPAKAGEGPPDATRKVTRTDASGGDSQLGNLVARSMQLQEAVQAEFAITNSLGIRADFEQGALTVEQMFNVFPFENSITVMYLSGRRGPADARLHRPPQRESWLPDAGAGLRHRLRHGVPRRLRRRPRHARRVREERRARRQLSRQQPRRADRLHEVRAAGAERALPRRRQRLHRRRWLGLRRPQAQHVEAGHRRVAARWPARVPQHAQPLHDRDDRRHDAGQDQVRQHLLPGLDRRSARRPDPPGVRMSARAVTIACAVLAAGACTDTRDAIVGTQSIEVELISPAPGDVNNRLPDTMRTVVLNLRAKTADNTVDTTFEATLNVYAQFLGTLTPALDQVRLATVPLVGGVAMNVTITLPPSVFGATTLWFDNGTGIGPEYRHGDLAGNSPTIWYRDPFIQDLQRPRDEMAVDALSTTPLQDKQIRVGTSRNGATGALVITSTFAQGYTVSDVNCTTGGEQPTPPCTTGDYDHALVFTFSAPRDQYGHPLVVGEVISSFNGGLAEFNGLTEVGFPRTAISAADRDTPPFVDEALLPPPALFDLAWFGPLSSPTGRINFEKHEAGAIELRNVKVCPLDDGVDGVYSKFKQWTIDPSVAGDQCSSSNVINLITAGTDFVTDPHTLVGRTLPRVVGIVRPVNIGSFNVWIVYPRGARRPDPAIRGLVNRFDSFCWRPWPPRCGGAALRCRRLPRRSGRRRDRRGRDPRDRRPRDRARARRARARRTPPSARRRRPPRRRRSRPSGRVT